MPSLVQVLVDEQGMQKDSYDTSSQESTITNGEIMNTFKNLIITEGFYFIISSIALSSLLMSSSDFNTKTYGILEFIATVWVTVAWILNQRKQRQENKK
ncbi:MAG: hypothetical protein KGH65_05600 [Candidatus Micrarchaeota archaeon]|nr:hypothetical protein [Candidatus Micrarchaeota archaeon]